ncbi:MAG: hypothetical protein HYY24_15610 [Verrucomicrobia bacterium]|nr:hypothetical protein [Verrucomicrobiota bacterium]
MRNLLDRFQLDGSAHLPASRVNVVTRLFLHWLRLAGYEAVVDQRRSFDDARIRGDQFAVADENPVPHVQLS